MRHHSRHAPSDSQGVAAELLRRVSPGWTDYQCRGNDQHVLRFFRHGNRPGTQWPAVVSDGRLVDDGFARWSRLLVAVGTAHVVQWQYNKYGTKLLMPLAM